MRQSLRCLAILAASGIAVGGLSSCSLVKAKTYEDDATLSGKITAVRLDIGSGGATINGVPAGRALSLHRKIEYRGDKPAGPTHRIENGVLVLGRCGSRCSVDYTVDVPAGIPVSGETSSGSVHLAKVGSVKVTTHSGDVEMSGVTGTVEARTSNGDITGKGIKAARIQAQTSNGGISLTPDAPADVRARTSNGDITLTMPRAGYRVSADTHNGDKNIDVPDDPSGRYELGLKTSNGDITAKTS
ncbi:hypothetical protein SRB17_64780 [Streptomyces sp. RB17]|uniref:DUF4097 family beta strand repeat-containing protein n=1 Tax=Streptomyces sp. RB17 TaxID=2585197 RepID=UPI001294CEE2|nr:DUF4097 family beta strand repeat-containing protein [Streptomyces sp. RB17]MQY38465.1 hypothetical protein [Streptomyces sp. RB17]